jgi:hypothetical protein
MSKKRVIVWLVLLVVLAALFVACGSVSVVPDASSLQISDDSKLTRISEGNDVNPSFGIYRFEDQGHVCYVAFFALKSVAISCIP